MKFNYDFDTAPYFEIVASTLISRHGEDALMLADHAIRKMRNSGDAEGIFMWEGVRSAIFDTILDSLGGLPSGVGEDLNAEDNPTMQGLYH
jgi:hypothetical protein